MQDSSKQSFSEADERQASQHRDEKRARLGDECESLRAVVEMAKRCDIAFSVDGRELIPT